MNKLLNHLTVFFKHDEKGVIAVIFAAMMLPLLALAGAAVDYSQATSIKNQIQTSADSAALAGGREYAQNNNEAHIEGIVEKVFSENIVNSGFADAVEVEVVFIEDGIRVEASTSMPTNFLKLVGKPTLDIAVFSEIAFSISNLEIVLVLDNTNSMHGNKLAALKTSAKNLVNTVLAGGSDKVKVALVPFSQYVNIGMSNRNEPGVLVPNDYKGGSPVEQCDWKKTNPHSCIIDGVPSTCFDWVKSNCTQALPDYKWYGHVGSRGDASNPIGNRLNLLDESYDTDPIPGLMTRWNRYYHTKPLTRLTSDLGTITSAIDNMATYAGEGYFTYIPVGLIWGWRLLSSSIPFTDAADYDDGYKKVLILMSDGKNTRSKGVGSWQGMLNNGALPNEGDSWHFEKSRVDSDKETAILCTNIKEKEIIVYTIAFEISDAKAKAKDILENCAGGGGRYFDADDANELEQAFKDIAKDLNGLRLSR